LHDLFLLSPPTAAEKNMSGVSTSPDGDSAKLKALVLGALGVVYGDIGTSPLYTIRECLTHGIGFDLSEATILGVLSLIFWSLILVVTIKYVVYVMRADNDGEGGILALTALALRGMRARHRRTVAVMFMGLIGAALFYGECLITPAISVLGAVEGLAVVAPSFHSFIVPIAAVVLVVLFLFQSGGTSKVGAVFGPIMVIWFLVLGILGVVQIAQQPQVLAAVSPVYAFNLLSTHGGQVFLLLGGVVLAVTGAEALYADMGHFGRNPIRIAWYIMVLPCLLLNYFGQGALLLHDPAAIENPFFHMAPDWGLIPMVILATAAAVIASQAVISGAFSVTRQAMQLRYLPRLRVDHTSEHEIGQIYLPGVNWLLLVGVLALVFMFKSSSALANAYGIAVTGTMVMTTLLSYKVARRLGKWSRWKAGGMAGLFLTIDISFFASTLSKFMDGGWFPVTIAGLMFITMITWRKGRGVLQDRLAEESVPLESLLGSIKKRNLPRVSGTAVFLTADRRAVPTSLLHNLKHNQVLHERVALLTVEVEDIPYYEPTKRVEVTPLQGGFYRVVIHFGFKDEPNVPKALQEARVPGLPFDEMTTSYFVNRETFIRSSRPGLPAWQEPIFITLTKFASSASEYYLIPPGRVVELGRQVEI
jgi:KUP system potassium uptake protein